MKILFLSLVFVSSFIVCSGQNSPPPGTQRGFIVVILDGQALTIEPIYSIDFNLVTETAPAEGRTRPAPGTNTLSTEILLKRRYERNADWKIWFMEYQSNPRTKQCELRTVDPEGRLENLTRRAEAFPIRYQLDSGLEILTIKVINIEF